MGHLFNTHAQQVLTWLIDEISKVVDDLSHEFNLDFRHSLGMELDSRLVVVKKVNRTGWSLSGLSTKPPPNLFL